MSMRGWWPIKGCRCSIPIFLLVLVSRLELVCGKYKGQSLSTASCWHTLRFCSI